MHVYIYMDIYIYVCVSSFVHTAPYISIYVTHPTQTHKPMQEEPKEALGPQRCRWQSVLRWMLDPPGVLVLYFIILYYLVLYYF